ncbi:MAG TPA: sodium:calcium antiporter [Candidatus Limnocylindria bacterium]|nr:sodium:calcium antiporter [Candidatus Limnocylindria bacterium]
MSLLVDAVLLLVSFVVILAGAELFTNGIEWFGKKLGLGEGMVGSVLAAVGTALPETMIPIIAIVFTATAEAHEIGIGAILGAPFMLSTAAMFVTGMAVLIYARRGRRTSALKINQRIVGRDLRFFLGMYLAAVLLGLPYFDKPRWFSIAAGIALVVAYVLYVRQTAKDPTDPDAGHEELNPLRLQPNLTTPHMRAVVLQLFVSLAAIVGGAQLFVREITVFADVFQLSPLVLSLIIAPLATELPEKFNSVLWIRQRKDTLAMGNISGAMVFQSCIPVAVGLWFTNWVLTPAAIASVVIAIVAGLLLQFYLRTGKAVTGRELASLGIFYVAFIVYVVGFYQGPVPAPH